jgi:hypothetical protein
MAASERQIALSSGSRQLSRLLRRLRDSSGRAYRAALCGDLGVAGKLTGDTATADHQVKAGAAFSALVNTLVIALVALLPAASLGAASIALAATGLASTAGLIIFLWREHQERIRLGQILLLGGLVILHALQLANGIQLEASVSAVSAVDNQGVLLIIFFLFAIARAWQLVGARDTRLMSTVAEMAHRQVSHGVDVSAGDEATEAGRARNGDDPV